MPGHIGDTQRFAFVLSVNRFGEDDAEIIACYVRVADRKPMHNLLANSNRNRMGYFPKRVRAATSHILLIVPCRGLCRRDIRFIGRQCLTSTFRIKNYPYDAHSLGHKIIIAALVQLRQSLINEVFSMRTCHRHVSEICIPALVYDCLLVRNKLKFTVQRVSKNRTKRLFNEVSHYIEKKPLAKNICCRVLFSR